jgi:hypothetical protein
MQIHNLDFITQLIESGDGFEAKCIFNNNGAIFFRANCQHRDQKAPGISYEDNYKGNALAAMLTPDRFEIRYHARFEDAAVARIMAHMTHVAGLAWLKHSSVTYQGRSLDLGTSSHPRN